MAIEPFHLFRYLDEQSFRYNQRKDTDGQRFATAAGSLAGRRVTYDELIGNNDAQGERAASDRGVASAA
ncbi:hypothetical protein D3C83_146870 [compost metagenome]